MSSNIILKSLGAAQNVTGSKHLLMTPELTILVDCGLFQGLKALREKNWVPLQVDVTKIDVLLLTHAHLDHCGYIPLLVKQGFRGKIYTSAPTRDLAEIILYDSAKIQEEDAENANRHKYTKHDPALPLYTSEDVKNAMLYFNAVEHNEEIKLSDNITVRFTRNGHILGSCSIQMTCFNKKLIFSGDIGRYTSTYMAAPLPLDPPDFVVMESTYGDRLHGDADPTKQLESVINDAIAAHGSVLIPSFAVGRAQEIMHILSMLKEENRIPKWIPIFMDSPMAASVTNLFMRYPEWHTLTDKECEEMCEDVTINTDYHNTELIIKKHGPKIVISSSGMLSGGRVLEYMQYMAGDKNNFILLIGYQAEGTRGRELQNHAREIKLHGKYYAVNANIVEITGLSGHADQAELLRWLEPFEADRKAKIFLVHGEREVQDVFRVKVKTTMNAEVTILVENEEMNLYETP